MSKSDVSASPQDKLAKHADATIVKFTIEDKIPEKNDAVIKIKNVSNFLGIDTTKYKITGHHETKNHTGISHHKLTFTLRNKKTKKVEQLVIDFLKQPNEKKFIGAVTLVITSPTKDAALDVENLLGKEAVLSYSKSLEPSEKDEYNDFWVTFDCVCAIASG